MYIFQQYYILSLKTYLRSYICRKKMLFYNKKFKQYKVVYQ